MAVAAQAQFTPKNYAVNLGNFTDVRVKDAINVIITADTDSAGYVTFATTDNLAPRILLNNDKGTLKIQVQDDGFVLKNLPTLHVHTQFLSRVENTGDSAVAVVNPAPGAQLNLRVEGNGSIDATGVHVTQLEGKIDLGSGTLTIQGNAKSGKLRSVGRGTIQAGNLALETASILIGGTGNVDCNVSRQLTITGLGSGKVYLRGKPEIKNRTLGSVKVVEVE